MNNSIISVFGHIVKRVSEKIVTKNKKRLHRSSRSVGSSLYPLYRHLGIVPRDERIYQLAMRHSSCSVIDKKTQQRINNERLEFLGDSILSAIVSAQLYLRYPMWDEGEMSKRKSSIVARNVNNKVGARLQLHKYIKSRSDVSRMSPDVLGNAVEALIGAIYLDRGFAAAERFVCNFIFPVYRDLEESTDLSIHNYKSELLEWAQKHHFQIEFKQQSYTHKGTDIFHYTVEVNGQVIGSGTGSSKKKAHQEAAYNAIEKLRKAENELSARTSTDQ